MIAYRQPGGYGAEAAEEAAPAGGAWRHGDELLPRRSRGEQPRVPTGDREDRRERGSPLLPLMSFFFSLSLKARRSATSFSRSAFCDSNVANTFAEFTRLSLACAEWFGETA